MVWIVEKVWRLGCIGFGRFGCLFGRRRLVVLVLISVYMCMLRDGNGHSPSHADDDAGGDVMLIWSIIWHI